MISPRRGAVLLVALTWFLTGQPLRAQTPSALLTTAYGRSVVEVETSRSQPGGVLGVAVRKSRWATANILLDGRRGALTKEAGGPFGLIPLALDTLPGEHRMSLFFPGGRRRGGSTKVVVPVTAAARPGRVRALLSESFGSATIQTALGHGRFLLSAIRTHDPDMYQVGPLRPPVDRPISFPFGGFEDYGTVVGPFKDGLMGEQHRGVDYDVPIGTPVKAPGLGIVILARSLVFSGETVVINHGAGLISVLSHLSFVNVREGEVVKQGATVGTSGKTGIGALTNPHLCFSVYLHALNVDPEALMDPLLWTGSR